jgi:hypothetical protein
MRRSVCESQAAEMIRQLAFAVFAAWCAAAPAKAATDLACLTPAESREAVARLDLARPAAVLREAARRERGDPLHNRLCRWNNDLVYEITLLRRDGKVTHVFVKARTGLFVDVADH